MGSNFNKTILILNGDKTKSGLAIKALGLTISHKPTPIMNKFFEYLKVVHSSGTFI